MIFQKRINTRVYYCQEIIFGHQQFPISLSFYKNRTRTANYKSNFAQRKFIHGEKKITFLTRDNILTQENQLLRFWVKKGSTAVKLPNLQRQNTKNIGHYSYYSVSSLSSVLNIQNSILMLQPTKDISNNQFP